MKKILIIVSLTYMHTFTFFNVYTRVAFAALRSNFNSLKSKITPKTFLSFLGMNLALNAIAQTVPSHLLLGTLLGEIDPEATYFMYEVLNKIEKKHYDKIKNKSWWQQLYAFPSLEKTAIHEAGHAATGEYPAMLATIKSHDDSRAFVMPHPNESNQSNNVIGMGGVAHELLHGYGKLRPLISGSKDAKDLKMYLKYTNIDLTNKEKRQEIINFIAEEAANRLLKDNMANEIAEKLKKQKTLGIFQLSTIWDRYRK